MNNRNQKELNGKGTENNFQFQQGITTPHMNLFQQQQQQLQQYQHQNQQQQSQSQSYQQPQSIRQQTSFDMNEDQGQNNEFNINMNQSTQNNNQFNSYYNPSSQQQYNQQFQQIQQFLQNIDNNNENINNSELIQQKKKFNQFVQSYGLNQQSLSNLIGGTSNDQFNLLQKLYQQQIMSPQKYLNLKNSGDNMEQEGRMNPEIITDNQNSVLSEIDQRNNPTSNFHGQNNLIEHVQLADEEDDDEFKSGELFQHQKNQSEGKQNQVKISQFICDKDFYKKIPQKMNVNNQKMRDEKEEDSVDEIQYNNQDNENEQNQDDKIKSIKNSNIQKNNSIKSKKQMINMYCVMNNNSQKEQKNDINDDCDQEESKKNKNQDEDEFDQYQTSQYNSKQKFDNQKLMDKIKQHNYRVSSKQQELNIIQNNSNKKEQAELLNEKLMKMPFQKIIKHDEKIKNVNKKENNSFSKNENNVENSSDNESNQQDINKHNEFGFNQEIESNHLFQLQQNVGDISPIHQNNERRNRQSPSSSKMYQQLQQKQRQPNNFMIQSQSDSKGSLYLQQQQQLSQQNNQNQQSQNNQFNLRNSQNSQQINFQTGFINQLNNNINQINNNITPENPNQQQQNIIQQIQMNQQNANSLNTDRANQSNRQGNNLNQLIFQSQQGNLRLPAIQNFNQQIPLLNQQLTQRVDQSQNILLQSLNQSNQEQQIQNNIQQISDRNRNHNHEINSFNPNMQINQIIQSQQNLNRSAQHMSNIFLQGPNFIMPRSQNVVPFLQNQVTFPTEGDNGTINSQERQNILSPQMFQSIPRGLPSQFQQNQNAIIQQNSQNLIQHNRTQIQKQNHLPNEVKNKYYTYRQNNHPQEYDESEPYMKVTVMKTNQDNTSQNSIYIITPRGMVKSKKNTATDDIIIGRQESTKQQENNNGFSSELSEIRPNDIVLPPSDRAISRIHCKIIYKDGFRILRKIPYTFIQFLYGIKNNTFLPYSIGGIPDVALRLIWKFVRQKNSFYIVDIGSAQGTFIKIRSEKSQVIEKGQVFLIGAETQFHVLEVNHGNINEKGQRLEITDDNRMIECQSVSNMIPDEQDFINFLLHEKRQNTIIHGLTSEEQQKLDAINNQPDNDTQNNTTQLVDFKKNFKPYVKIKVHSTQVNKQQIKGLKQVAHKSVPYKLISIQYLENNQEYSIGNKFIFKLYLVLILFLIIKNSMGKWQLKDGDMNRESANGTWISLNDYREKTESRNESDQKEIEEGSEIKISDSILKIEICNNELKKIKPKYCFNLEEQMEQEQDLNSNNFSSNSNERQDLDVTG